jgi:type II secretory pathway component PulF
MATNAPNRALQTACAEMNPRVSSGTPFSELMKSYPGLFSPLMTGMMRAGEVGGFLDRMCLRLAEYAERDYEIQQTVKRETWYPKLLLFCSFLIPSIVPAAIAWFQGGNAFVAWIRAFIFPAMVMLAVILALRFKNYLAPLFKHFTPLTYFVDQIKLLIPIAGKTTRGLATAKFCRALGALQAAGMGVQQTINLSADACGNAVIAETSRKTIPLLESGATMTDALASTRQFPGVAIQMLRTGEATGNFDEQLDKVADFLEADAETTIKQSVVVLGIVIFLVMAVYIAITVISQYVNIYGGLIDDGIQLAE